MIRTLRLGFAFAAASLLALPPAAAAAPLLVSFTGSVSNVDAALSAQFTIGDPVSGSFVYESTTPDSQAADPAFAVYSGAVQSGTFTFGSYAATGSTGSIVLQLGTSSDTFEAFVGSVTGPSVGSFAVEGLQLSLSDSTATAFSDDSLPTSLDLADFDVATASIGFDDGNVIVAVFANVSTLSVTPVAVPEPAMAWLLAGALAWCASRRGRPA